VYLFFYLLTYVHTDKAATTFNNLAAVTIGGNLNRENKIIDHFWGIIAGTIVCSTLSLCLSRDIYLFILFTWNLEAPSTLLRPMALRISSQYKQCKYQITGYIMWTIDILHMFFALFCCQPCTCETRIKHATVFVCSACRRLCERLSYNRPARAARRFEGRTGGRRQSRLTSLPTARPRTTVKPKFH